MPRPDARQQLLDAGERLFALHGIPTVSDRQIAEAASNSNHSAVRYYFGGRAGLMQALLERHSAAIEPRQRQMFEQSDSLLGDVRALVLPMTRALSDLQTPSWRARFLDQAVHDPATAALMRGAGVSVSESRRIVSSIADRLCALDRVVVENRARLVAHVISTACAEIEERAETSGEPAQWPDAGAFLCDAIAGLLQAPITRDQEPRSGR